MQYPPNSDNQPPFQPWQNNNPQSSQSLYHGQFQPPYDNPPPPSSLQNRYLAYSGWFLAALIILYILAIGMIFIEIIATGGITSNAATSSSSSSAGILSTIAVILFLAFHGLVIVKDGGNFFTLFYKIHWQQLKGWLKVVLVFVYLSVIIMTGIYLVVAFQFFLRARRQTLSQSLHDGWLGYRRKNKNVQIGIALACVFLLLSLITFTSFAAMADRMHALARLTPTVISQQAVSNVDTMSNKPEATNIAISVSTQQSTPTLRLKPSPAPILRSIVKPTPKATQPPLKLIIMFTCASAVDYSYGHVCVHVQPGAALTITVTYCSGYTAKSASLQGTFYADSGGNYTWSWKPETKCRGKATADVNASWDGQNISNSDNFTVQ